MNEYNLMSYSKLLKNRLKKVSSPDAKKFLYKHGYNCSSFIMPDYYEAHGFDKMSLKALNWKNVPVTKTMDIFTPKGNLSWRRYSFIHPYMYWHIVDVLTEEENWKTIKDHLCQPTQVACYSTPDFSLSGGQKIQGQSIERWLQMAERDLIKDCAGYNCLTFTDVQNFYSSIYTHSIAWALHTKEKARSDKKRKLVGNKLDKLFQYSRGTQTNGIPIGSLVSDIIAEIVLTDVDVGLSKWLVNEKLDSDILVSRFRDDYRILSRNTGDASKVLKKLNRILHEKYDLSINSNKTQVYEDVVEKAFRPWDLEMKRSFLYRVLISKESSERMSFNLIRDILLETYSIQKRYPRGRVSITILSKLADKISGKQLKIDGSSILELIAILQKIIHTREEVTPNSILLIDSLLSKFNKRKKNEFIEEMAKMVSEKTDADYQLIWIYRLCLSQAPEMCKKVVKMFKKVPPLVKIVVEYKKFNKNKDYCSIFPIIEKISQEDEEELKKFSFINIKKLTNSKRVRINVRSVNPFKYKKA